MRIKVLLVSSAVLLFLGTGILAASQTDISWDVIGGGGGRGSVGAVAIADTVGQAVIGPAQSGEVAIGSGFWYGVEGTPTSVPTDTPTLTPTSTYTPTYTPTPSPTPTPTQTPTPTPTQSPTLTPTPTPTPTGIPSKYKLHLPLVNH